MQVFSFWRVPVAEHCSSSSPVIFGLSTFVAHHFISILQSAIPKGEKENSLHWQHCNLSGKDLTLYVLEFGWPRKKLSPFAQTLPFNAVIASKGYVRENGARELSCIICLWWLQPLMSWQLYLASSQDGSASSELEQLKWDTELRSSTPTFL